MKAATKKASKEQKPVVAQSVTPIKHLETPKATSKPAAPAVRPTRETRSLAVVGKAIPIVMAKV